MEKINNRSLLLVFLFSGLFILSHLFLAREAIKKLSPTYDEPVHLTAGYVYLKTKDYRMNGLHHPPLAEMWAAVPLLFLNPFLPKNHSAWLRQRWDALDQYQFADAFLFKNRVSAEKLMESSRWMQVVLSSWIGGCVAAVAGALAGGWAAFCAMGLWAFSPAFLTHGTIVSTDLAFSFFFFLFFWGVGKLKGKYGYFSLGFIFGLCCSSKFFGVALIPIWMALAACRWIFKKKSGEKFNFFEFIKYGPIFLVGFILSVSMSYQGGGFGLFWEGLNAFLTRAQSGRSSFFLGQHTLHGSIFYFPYTLLVKSPLALLVGLVISFILVLKKKAVIPLHVWLPPLLFLLLACFSTVQIGHRYVLAVYPFLFVVVGVALSVQRWTKVVGTLLLAWGAFSAVSVRPHFIAYFNELIGGPSQGFTVLTDSNVDWGQSLELLSNELEIEDKEKGIFLSYFGVVDPHHYGIRYLDIGSDSIAGHEDDSLQKNLNPTKFAISVTNLQSTYYKDKKSFSWLESYSPWKKVGHSIFIYDFKENPEALDRLYRMRGQGN